MGESPKFNPEEKIQIPTDDYKPRSLDLLDEIDNQEREEKDLPIIIGKEIPKENTNVVDIKPAQATIERLKNEIADPYIVGKPAKTYETIDMSARHIDTSNHRGYDQFLDVLNKLHKEGLVTEREIIKSYAHFIEHGKFDDVAKKLGFTLETKEGRKNKTNKDYSIDILKIFDLERLIERGDEKNIDKILNESTEEELANLQKYFEDDYNKSHNEKFKKIGELILNAIRDKWAA